MSGHLSCRMVSCGGALYGALGVRVVVVFIFGV